MTAALVFLGLTVSLTYAQEVDPVLIVGTDASEVVTGTPAKDSLYGRAGDDVLGGLGDDDDIDGGPGADVISGGVGRDSVSYAGTGPVDATLDGVANDGAPGEGDNVLLDTEDIFGTEGPDKLTGNGLENTIDGNGGDDQITGGSGADGLFGGDGDDRIFSRDGSADRVECGLGNDIANVDVRDRVIECETVGRVTTTENFPVSVLGRGSRRASRFRLANILTGSRVTFACVSRCRPRSPSSRVVYRRSSIRSIGGARRVNITIPRSRFIAGSTFEIGVKARKAKPRCRRFKLASRRGVISNLVSSRKRCTSIARNG